MANYFARKAGNINATDVWATTPSGTAGDFFPSFTNADVLHSNNFAITVNVNATVAEVRNDNANSATAGGSFTLSNSVTLTANAFGGVNGTACVIFSGASPNSATLVGNANAGSINNSFGASNTSTGTLVITGNVNGGTAISSEGARNTSTGTLTITGNATGGSGASAYGCNNNSTGTLTITGNATGGSGASAFGCNNASTGTMTVVGTINASEFASGVGGGNRGQVTLLTGPFIASTTFGVNPIGNLSWRWAASLNDQTYITVPTNNLLATRNLVTPDNATNFPAASNVRSAITYGIGGALTGTCAVPPAGSVAFGVPVDNTTGTATLSAAQIWDYALSAITTSSTIGKLLKDNVDATISSRSTATTAGIADAVWDEVMSGHTINGTYGDRIVRSLNSNNTLQLTGSHHAAADIHEFQNEVIADYAFAPSAVTLFVDAVRTELTPELDEIGEIHAIHGLKSGESLTVTPTSRSAGAISQTISGDGTTTTTVSRD